MILNFKIEKAWPGRIERLENAGYAGWKKLNRTSQVLITLSIFLPLDSCFSSLVRHDEQVIPRLTSHISHLTSHI